MRFIKTDKFVDNSISIRMFLPFERKTITVTNLALRMLKRKTEAFPSLQHVALALNEAYSFRVSLHMTGLGNRLMIEYRFQYLQSQYCPTGLEDSTVLKIMDQFLFHPLVDVASFEECKAQYEDKLLRLQDDPDYLSSSQCLSLLDKGHTSSISIQGYQSDLETLSYQDVQKRIHKIMSLKKHVYVCGRPSQAVLSYLQSIDAPLEPVMSMHPYQGTEYRESFLQKEIAQTSLTMAFKTNITIKDKLSYPLVLLNSVLGQCPNNLLFDTIREKHSLCYAIHSSLIRYDGLLLVQTGLSKANFEQVKLLIQDQMQRIQSMDYSDELLENAKKDWIDSIRSIQDLPFSWMEQVFSDDYLHQTASIAQRISKIQRIKKEDIALAAHHLSLCALALVEENDEEV